jgi:16S rRNA (cytidine1402-2'-O)-methyltransferase
MEDTKRQVLPAGLWVVATPIGNLADFTQRGRFALAEAEFILCEDTRRTAQLLGALGFSQFKQKLHRLDAHSSPAQIQKWVETLQDGKNVALVTDAGTPGISDPGAALVRKAQEAKIQMTPIPGASAPISLLSVSGFQETSFTFRGYFPRSPQDQKTEIQLASKNPMSRIFVWFESPMRIRKALASISAELPDVQIVVAKELTKLYERLFAGTATDVALQINHELDQEGEVGEWCFAVHFGPRAEMDGMDENSNENSQAWKNALKCLLSAGVSVSESSKQISQNFGIPKKRSYEAALQVSGKKKG